MCRNRTRARRSGLVVALVAVGLLGGCMFWNARPTASFDVSADPAPGLPVQFTNTSSDPNGFDDLKRFVWDLGDGTIADTFNVSHTYAEIGTYTVTLTVHDGKDEADTCQKTIEVRSRVFGLPEEVAVGKRVSGTGSGSEITPGTRYSYSSSLDAWVVVYYAIPIYVGGQLAGFDLLADDIIFWARVPFVDDLNQAVLLSLQWQIEDEAGAVVGAYRDPQEYALSQGSLVGGIDAIMSYWSHVAGTGSMLPEGRYTTRLRLTDEISGEFLLWEFPFIVESQMAGYL